MSELRQNCLTGDWVVMATERAKRPRSYVRESQPGGHAVIDCPFCSGNESLTPPEIMALRPTGSEPDGPGWQVRVVPNKFPAFTPEATAPLPVDRLHPILAGVGAHEVIIHSPEHEQSLGRLDVADVARIFSVYQSRLRAFAGRSEFADGVIIVNHGSEAGASLSHPHSQFFVVPMVSPRLERELKRFKDHYADSHRCLLCDLVESEIKDGERLVAETDDFLAFAPFASRVPFEIYITPKKHMADFAEADEQTISAAAEMMRLVTGRMYDRLGDVAHNVYLHNRPFRSDAHYHWHFSILPKTSIIAGFEFATDIMINVVEPETAAEFLR